MLDVVRFLLAALLAAAPFNAQANQTCDLTSKIMEVDILFGLEARNQASLQRSLDALVNDPAVIAGTLSAQGNPLALPAHERASLVATIATWREWNAVAQRGGDVGLVPAARLTPSLRHRMDHVLRLCGDRSGGERGGGSLALPAHHSGSSEGEAEGRGSPDASGTVGTALLESSNGLTLLALLFGTSVGAITLVCRLDDRQDKRHRYRSASRVILGDYTVADARFWDLSRSGCCLELSVTPIPDPGTPCLVALGPRQMDGAVVWANDRRMGVVFRRRLSRHDIAAILAGRQPDRSGTVSSPFGPAGSFPQPTRF